MQYGEPYFVPQAHTHPGKPKRTARILVVAGLAAVVALLLAAGGFYLYCAGQYGQALSCINDKDYAGACRLLSGIPPFYKDTPSLGDYAGAWRALEEGDFAEAASAFGSLGGFRDSESMLIEVSYRRAAAQYSRGDLKAAIAAYKALGEYKDSAALLENISYEVFHKAVEDYRSADYKGAKAGFSIARNYDPVVAIYLDLIEAHTVTAEESSGDYEKTKALFDKLAAIGDFEDAAELATSGAFLPYRLEGSWYLPSGEMYVEMKYDKTNKVWLFAGNKLDGAAFKVQGSSIWHLYEGNWLEMNRFGFLSADMATMTWIVYDHEGARDILTRR